jgi:hypothetical protein
VRDLIEGGGPDRRAPVRGRAPLSAGCPTPTSSASSPQPAPQSRAGDEYCRDLAHHSRHPLRRRHRPRPDQPLLARRRAPAASRSSPWRSRAPTSARAGRARGRGRLHPVVFGKGLPGAPPLHPAGDPAGQPGRRHPAAQGLRPGRHRAFPVHQPAREQGDPRRLLPCSRRSEPSPSRPPTPPRRPGRGT